VFVCFVIVGFLYSELFRYGIRVDPEQWLIVLTGRHEGGADHPSVILIMCMYLLFAVYKPIIYMFDLCACYEANSYHSALPWEIRVSEL
jgi:hypothetical protein